MKKDYYEILGVSRSADEKQIRSAYRKLARKYHPDLNKEDNQAEERFKEVAEAFAVLSDKDKRAQYNRGGHDAFGPGFDPFAGSDPGGFDVGFGDLSSIFEMFGLGGAARAGRSRRGSPFGAPRGSDLRFEMSVPFVQAIQGGEVAIAVQRPNGEQERIKLRIPAGVEAGTTLKLAGKGNPGPPGTPAGDVYLTLGVEPHPALRLEGRDLVCDVSVGLARAALGGKVQVRTIDGTATVNIPAGTRSGQRLRLRGKGVPAANGKPAGNLYAVVQIHPPKKLDGRSRELLEEFDRLNPVP